MTKNVEYFGSEKGMAERAVGIFREEYAKAAPGKGFFSVVLSGGRTPALFFRKLAAQKGLDWRRIFFFFADERLVDRKNKNSNFKTANDLLFSKAPIPPLNIFTVPVSEGSGTAAAYEKIIRGFFRSKGGGLSFDLVFLGLGTDGHTASLFPGSPALGEKKKLAISVLAPPYARPRRRVTLTLSALNSAKIAVFLVSGRAKKTAFDSLVKAQKNLPASGIRPAAHLYLFYSK
jgi:6-phosphogluconolactonase